MKVLVVLVLAVFTGCNANFLYADEPKSQLEQVTDVVREYVNKVTQTADDTFQMVKKSQFGQDVNARFTEGMDLANTYVATLQENLPPQAQEIITKVSAEAEVLRTSLDEAVKNLQTQLEPYTDDLKVKMEQQLQDFKEKVAPLAERAQVELTQRATQVREMAAPYVEDLREQLNPYAEDLKTRLTELYDSIAN